MLNITDFRPDIIVTDAPYIKPVLVGKWATGFPLDRATAWSVGHLPSDFRNMLGDIFVDWQRGCQGLQLMTSKQNAARFIREFLDNLKLEAVSTQDIRRVIGEMHPDALKYGQKILTIETDATRVAAELHCLSYCKCAPIPPGRIAIGAIALIVGTAMLGYAINYEIEQSSLSDEQQKMAATAVDISFAVTGGWAGIATYAGFAGLGYLAEKYA